MDISIQVYETFYKVLLDFFEERIKLVLEPEKRPQRGSEEFWEVRNLRSGVFLFDEVFPHINVKPNHFRKKKYTFNAMHEYGRIKEDVLINALENGIGISIPEQERANFRERNAKAHKLYLLFIEQHCKEYLNEEEERLKGGVRKKNKESHKSISLSNRTAEEISHLVCSFYTCVNDLKLKDAWDLIHPDFQERVWKSKYQDFFEGYSNTISITNIHVFDIDEVNKNCKVYYEDRVDVLTTLDLIGLDKITIDELSEFVERVKKFQIKVENADLKNVLSVEIAMLFNETLSEYIKFTRQVPMEKLKNILPHVERHTIYRLFKVVCGKHDNILKIKSIDWVKPVRLR